MSRALDTTELWKLAETMAQDEIDLLYPNESEGARASEFERLRDMYYRQLASPTR